MDKVRFGIIGCGSVTEVKSGPAFQKVPGSSLEMVMRRDAAKLKDYAARHQVPRYSTDYLDLLRDPDINAIYVATPPDTHAFYTIEAARHGKAVYVEKPMARTVAECKAMIKACGDAGVPLFVAYYRRGQPKFLKAREMLETGVLGQLRSFTYLYACPPPDVDPQRLWLFEREKAGGGLLYDIGSHMVDTILFLLGDPLEVIGRSANLSAKHGTDDLSSALFRFASGVQGVVQLSFSAAEQIDRLWISGSEGSMTLSIMSNDPIAVDKDGETRFIHFEPLQHVQQPYIEKVVGSLLGRVNLECSGKDALLTQELLETIDQSGAWGKPAN